MPYISTQDLEKIGVNRYEAVIIASRHARHLNAMRLAQLQKLEEGQTVDIEARKITMVAMKELLEGKVNYERSDIE